MSYTPASPSIIESADYRYILTNTMDDEVVSEIPFSEVSYSNVLNEAGTFSGKISVNDATLNLDLYNSTTPGLRSLYVLRGDACVWGGIVSGRTYDAKTRELTVTADQFVSYLDRRVLWKTWSTQYSCTIDIEDITLPGATSPSRIGKVTLSGGSSFNIADLRPGIEGAFISFGDDADFAVYSGTYTILATPAPDPDGKFFYFSAFYRAVDKKNFKEIKELRIADGSTSVRFKESTRIFLRDLIKNHFNDDTYDLSFANDVIAAGEIKNLDIAGFSRTGDTVTVTVDSTDAPHNLVVGQRIAIRDIQSPYTALNREKTTVTEIVDNLRFKYKTTTSGSVPATTPTIPSLSVDTYQRVRNIVTIVTNSVHGLAVGDVVSIVNLDDKLDAIDRYTVTTVGEVAAGSSTEPLKVFQVRTVSSSAIGFSKAPSDARIRKIPVVYAYSGGPYTRNSNIGIIFDDESFDSLNETQKVYQEAIRGYELMTFKEIIDKFSDDIYGFDYRIDCSFDPVENKFSKRFDFLPLRPREVSNKVQEFIDITTGSLPEDFTFSTADFGADRLVFEYPGNISDLEMVETLEQGATRLFAQGLITELSDDVSQPYAAAPDVEFLRLGWPLFDRVIKKEKISQRGQLFTYANSVLSQAQLPVSTITITVNGSLSPVLGEYKIGDWCLVAVDDLFIQERLRSYYEQRGALDTEERFVLLRKIAAIDVRVPINPGVPEIVTLTLVNEPGIDITGKEANVRWPRTSSGGGGLPLQLL